MIENAVLSGIGALGIGMWAVMGLFVIELFNEYIECNITSRVERNMLRALIIAFWPALMFIAVLGVFSSILYTMIVKGSLEWFQKVKHLFN